ncbi:MAG: metallophosphoesterase [Bacteroidia bacterium]|nr:metallophosphoesterase [Bacteroidia bacterium]
MKRILTLIFFVVIFGFHALAQKSSFIVLGDLHYDLLQDHDMNWLGTKPGDLRQVTEEYTKYTRENWNDFTAVLKKRVVSNESPVKAIIQLGDLSEGLAGSEEKARQMAADVMKAINDINMPVPWIIAKGNHDITGPGAVKAFQEFYIPVFQKQTGNPEINSANYSFRCQDIQITCIDPWDKESDMTAFLERELSGSNAKYKFVAIHEPVIPVTERCWHTLRNNLEQRQKLLEIIARNKAIVLCGHLHRYSVVRRTTQYGPVVQVMVMSVVSDRTYQKPVKVITEYGPSLAENVPDWQPETLEARKAILSEEAKYVTWYKQTDLPGYAIIDIDEKNNVVLLKYYAAFADKPYDIIDLTKLLKP